MPLDKQKKKLMWAIFIIGLIQMPGLALTPGINRISTTAFAEHSLATIQSTLALSSLTQPVVALCAAMLINRGFVTKKAAIIFGLCLLAVNGVLAILMNTEFYHLIILSIVLGISTGCFISNMFGLMFDGFEPVQRQIVTGYQTSFINAGGIIMSLLGGLMATYMWYGGYLLLLVGLPAAVFVLFTVPSYKAPVRERGEKKSVGKLNPRIFYYCVITALFMMTYTVCGNNISTHISGIGDSGTAGIAMAFMMGGGVVSGLFFNKLSGKAGDYSISFAFSAVFVGYLLLSLFPASLPMTIIAVFVVGMSLSILLPRCVFMVSTLAEDPSASATASALVVMAAPSTGAFLSPIIFTNLTTSLFGESTVPRYRFVGFVALAIAVIIALMTMKANNNLLKKCA